MEEIDKLLVAFSPLTHHYVSRVFVCDVMRERVTSSSSVVVVARAERLIN